jgi:hypothetical protein
MQIFEAFPYDKRFTREEIAEITERSERIAEAMRDGVAPNGYVLNVPEDMLKLWSVHNALAGMDVHEDLAYIVSRPSKDGPFTDSMEWVLKEDAEKAGPTPEEEAAKYAAALKAELSPAAQKILAKELS